MAEKRYVGPDDMLGCDDMATIMIEVQLCKEPTIIGEKADEFRKRIEEDLKMMEERGIMPWIPGD